MENQTDINPLSHLQYHFYAMSGKDMHCGSIAVHSKGRKEQGKDGGKQTSKTKLKT